MSATKRREIWRIYLLSHATLWQIARVVGVSVRDVEAVIRRRGK